MGFKKIILVKENSVRDYVQILDFLTNSYFIKMKIISKIL